MEQDLLGIELLFSFLSAEEIEFIKTTPLVEIMLGTADFTKIRRNRNDED